MKRMAYIAIMMSIVIMFGCSNAVDTALTPSTNIDNPVATIYRCAYAIHFSTP